MPKPDYDTTVARLEQRLQEMRDDQDRLIAFAGVRLGVFAKLKELARREKRVRSKLAGLTENRGNIQQRDTLPPSSTARGTEG